MPSVRAGDLEVGYDVEGSGFPLVVLHGATSSGREDFAAQLPAVRKQFRVYLPDARAHGRTRWDVRDGFSQPLLTGDVAAFVDALGLTTFHLLGFSMGAMTAMTYATPLARAPAHAGPGGDHAPARATGERGRRLMDPERILRDEPGLGRRPVRAARPGAGRRGLAATAAHDRARGHHAAAPVAARIAWGTVPALVAIGDRDPFVPVDHGWGLKRQLPDARLLVAPDCGHEVMTRQPALFNTALAAFYRSTAETAQARAKEEAR